MRKPNYSMERKDRDRAKQAKAAAKLEKRQARGTDRRDPEEGAAPDGSADDPPPGEAKQGG